MSEPDPAPDRTLGPKAWTAIIAVTFVLGTATWIVASVLTARPSVDPTVHENILDLTGSQQPNPYAPSSYPELVKELIGFQSLALVTAENFPNATEESYNGTEVVWLVALEELGAEKHDHDLRAQQAIDVRRTAKALEEINAFDRVSDLLKSPNLASNYPGSLDAAGNPRPVMSWELPYLSACRVFIMAAITSARAGAESGDLECAAGRIESASALPGVLTRQAFFIEHMVGYSAAGVLVDEIERLCSDTDMTPQALKPLIRAQQNLAGLADFTVALRGARLSLRDTMYRAHTAGGRYIPSIGEQITSSSGPAEARGLRERLEDVTGYFKARRDANLDVSDELFRTYEAAMSEHDPAAREHLIESAQDQIRTVDDRY